jgi:hypothetical protein
MDILAKAQNLVVENVFTIGIVLLVTVLITAVIWFSMSRSVTKSPVLENQARVNETTTSPEESVPTKEELEAMAKYTQEMEAKQSADNQPQPE